MVSPNVPVIFGTLGTTELANDGVTGMLKPVSSGTLYRRPRLKMEQLLLEPSSTDLIHTCLASKEMAHGSPLPSEPWMRSMIIGLPIVEGESTGLVFSL